MSNAMNDQTNAKTATSETNAKTVSSATNAKTVTRPSNPMTPVEKAAIALLTDTRALPDRATKLQQLLRLAQEIGVWQQRGLFGIFRGTNQVDEHGWTPFHCGDSQIEELFETVVLKQNTNLSPNASSLAIAHFPDCN